jgi:hypothetical protein
MRHTTIILTFFALLALGTTASAQSVEHMRQRLAERNDSDSYVLVSEDDATASAVQAVENAKRATKVSGYRVVIYFSNGQYAGDKAQSVLAGFRSKYPGINAYLVYESPYFKVSVGDCLSMEEAQILMAKILGNYPKAFPRRESIALEALTTPLTPIVEPVDSLALPIVVEE